jgi:hybrid cluster-associated redox disulfide protein
MTITRKSKFSEVLEDGKEKAAEILFKAGLHCVGCPMTAQENLEDGCMAHGMEDKDIDKLVEELNK